MKYLKLPALALICLFLLTACQQNLPYSSVTRDDEMTGGSLSFSYNEEAHIAEFGGEGEIVQFYSADIAKGWEEEGCRVGIAFSAPSEVKDFEGSSIWVDGEKIAGGEFYQTVNGQKVGRVVLTPLVSEEKREIQIKVEWNDNSPAQTYKIRIKDGTQFMNKQ